MISTNDTLDNCPHALQGNSAMIFMGLINALFSAKCKMDPRKEYKDDLGEAIEEKNEFDFIIVGGGISGCILANRLSENPNWRVLLIEAGGYPNAESEIPLLYNEVLKSSLNWQFNTEHQNSTCGGFEDSRCKMSKGKVLGGSSTTNDMLFIPSIKEDFADWEDRFNIKGWGWDDISKYYDKAKEMLEATKPKSNFKIRAILQEALEELGMKSSSDNNKSVSNFLQRIKKANNALRHGRSDFKASLAGKAKQRIRREVFESGNESADETKDDNIINPSEFGSFETKDLNILGPIDIVNFVKKGFNEKRLTKFDNSERKTKILGQNDELKTKAYVVDSKEFNFYNSNNELIKPDTQLMNAKGNYYEDALVTIKAQQRFSSAKAYLAPIKYRENLFLLTKATVVKILMNKGKAFGVTISWDDEFINVTASMEVILAAGSINTPKLMMLSGIGPKNNLEEHSIPVLNPLPVGNNMYDQVGAYGIFVEIDGSVLKDVKYGQDDVYEYLTTKSGKLGNIGVANFLQYFSTTGEKTPNVKIQTFVYPKHDKHFLHTNILAYSFNKDTITNLVNLNKRHAFLHFVITLLNPESSGKIRLESTEPFEHPKIYSHYFSHRNDLQTLLDALKKIKKMLSTSFILKYKPKFLKYDLPGCNQIKFDTEEYWECNFHMLSTSTGTQVGGCRMGALDDHTTVVDEEFRVKDIDGLRVVDPSVLPMLGVGNYYGYAAMIGEKGADVIKENRRKMLKK